MASETQRLLRVLDDISDDMENDAKSLDGKPFDGRTVAEQFGNQAAAIRALAKIVRVLVAGEPPTTDGQEQ